MTAATTARSAYPRTVAELIPHARDLAEQLGKTPSRNELMKTFHVGADKAKALLAELTGTRAAENLPATGEISSAPAAPEIEPGAETPGEPEPRVIPVPPVPADADDMTAYRNAAGDLMVTYPNAAGDTVTERVSAVPESIRHRVRSAGLLDIARSAPAAAPVAAAEPAALEPVAAEVPAEPPTVEPVAEPEPPKRRRRTVTWPVLILCLPAFVAIWGGWVEMGRMTGFGMVTLLPGISDFQINTAITLPIGVETYAAYALYVWLSGTVTGPALRFAKWSAIGSLVIGFVGQAAYHQMAAAGWEIAPWPIIVAVSGLPVAVLGMGAGLAHLVHRSH
ncbi:hypothetical protein [Actinoplanes rectilineatus]|uniref:hypothetical protein n=1 Tax=Actinoplanes rectilineatus TaxID=113571 RepID=UPI0005F2B184|nr:hypothetical protein [Actinoplanes rectilineatus]